MSQTEILIYGRGIKVPGKPDEFFDIAKAAVYLGWLEEDLAEAVLYPDSGITTPFDDSGVISYEEGGHGEKYVMFSYGSPEFYNRAGVESFTSEDIDACLIEILTPCVKQEFVDKLKDMIHEVYRAWIV